MVPRYCCINEPVMFSLCVHLSSWTLGGVPVFLPSGQLSGSPCQLTQVLVIRDFATPCQLHVSTIMQYLCIVHVYMHTYALCGYTRHLHTCRYAAIHVNRHSGISQARQPYQKGSTLYWLFILLRILVWKFQLITLSRSLQNIELAFSYAVFILRWNLGKITLSK